jgi:hypothetical protein
MARYDPGIRVFVSFLSHIAARTYSGASPPSRRKATGTWLNIDIGPTGAHAVDELLAVGSRVYL